ncbi:hypothetical protein K437DRAFT_289427 [Tilletiaria anomala UBC 951]|uniref:Uncharacterized protein n=1 Tax=Tilletiaria anomala (strain ATCC 24038 / CBS 436.72 / UBC 951) TaxID=1037660 RepID=A0A066VM84_TILAU|nr:uncharacterized protein K437DRAFT_289427 [Tilletiaria anomala UBC 951]KDN39849.1 hypothetical protein K437DRAFT_289427 [Tilletiaria anomala UBC 951]
MVRVWISELKLEEALLEPHSHTEPLRSDDTGKSETAIKNNDTCVEVKLPSGRPAVDAKWILKVKREGGGRVQRNRSGGYEQPAPPSLDVKTAYLYAECKEVSSNHSPKEELMAPSEVTHEVVSLQRVLRDLCPPTSMGINFDNNGAIQHVLSNPKHAKSWHHGVGLKGAPEAHKRDTAQFEKVNSNTNIASPLAKPLQSKQLETHCAAADVVDCAI